MSKMSKGLKQMVAEAIKTAQPEPVEVSDEALRSMSTYMRAWSGWPNSHVEFGDPTKHGSPFAMCDHNTRTFTVNADRLVLNPNRVLLTVTPFRLKQEAVLTGAMLHEAGHARHSHWLPRDGSPAKHRDGAIASTQVVALARLMEEARVEGLMARDADKIGAVGLDWTMRASAAHLVPTTRLSINADQKVMDLITSWALRAGRQYALTYWTSHNLRNWVQDFTTLLHQTVAAHLMALSDDAIPATCAAETKAIIDTLIEMTHVTDDTGPTMLDKARRVLTLLFPETDLDDMPEPGKGCGGAEPDAEQDSDQSEDSEQGEDSAEQGSADDEAEQDSEQGEQDGEPEDGEQDSGSGQGSADDQPEDDSDEADEQGNGGASGSTDDQPEQDQPEQDQHDDTSDLAEALRDMEEMAADETEEETEEAEEEALAAGGGSGAGASSSALGGGWRSPTAEERGIAKGAERFLRDLIAPSDSSKRTLDDSPSAMVDGAAMAAWKAGGQRSAPNFFIRTRRFTQPSPPVQIAVLVDRSMSMYELQTPSAVLSWSLTSAALDLRNFAGRGQQIQSTLIHWGTTAEVIQKPGEMLPGIKEHDCGEYTMAMGDALRMVDEQMPGFFDITETPVNRLLIQFTDWELSSVGKSRATDWIGKALAAGVNMVSVVPRSYSTRSSDLHNILAKCPVQRGKSSLLTYDPDHPEQVWEGAAKALA